jgi:DNA-binding SARP family transcriptional activator/energy-coupling factor transporter ATP-binding protein EcfA2
VLQIYLLGQFHLTWNGQPLKVTAPPKTIPLLACLLLNREQSLKRETIAFTLWPDVSEKDARTNLRRHIFYLNKLLPETDIPWLLLAGDMVQWNPASHAWLDVATFEYLIADSESLAEAVELYTGDLLQDVYDDWVHVDREQLRDRYLSALSQLITRHRSKREYQKAIQYALRALACDPLREDIMRQMISLRYESGDRAGALRDYEQFVKLLYQELGVEPMPETRLVYEAVYCNMHLPGPSLLPFDEKKRDDQQSTLLPFSGRKTEMANLLDLWTQASHGQGKLVLLGGEAGIGKSRLVSELAMLVENQGGRVLCGSTSPLEARPYQAVIEAFEPISPLLASIDLRPIWVAALSTLLPRIAAQRTLPVLPVLAPQREHDRLFEALSTCLQQLSGPRPLLLILEDSQWCGDASIALLEWFARRLSAAPIMILVTYRIEEVGRGHPLSLLRRNLERDRLVENLVLYRLSAAEVETLLSSLPDLQFAPPLRHWLVEKSEGNPLFIKLFLQRLLESASRGGEQDLEHVPEDITAIISRRLEKLSEDARFVAEIAAAVGSSFNIEIVQEVAGWEACRTIAALNELMDRRLVREAGGRNMLDLVFTHDLIRSNVYRQISEQRLTRWHLRVGMVMEDIYANRLDEISVDLARHFSAGGELARAVPYCLIAARRAIIVYADEDARRYTGQGLALLERQTAFADLSQGLRLKLDLLFIDEDLAHRQGDRDRQKASLNGIEQVLGLLKDEPLMLEYLRRRIRCWQVMGERELEALAITDLDRRAGELGDSYWQAQALLHKSALLIALGQLSEAQAGLELARVQFRSAGNLPEQVTSLCMRAEAFVQQGFFEEANTALVEARQLAECTKDFGLLVQTLMVAAGALFTRQDFVAASEVTGKALEICRTIGDREGEADALARLAAISTRLFAIQTARTYYHQAGEYYHQLGKRQGQARVLVNTGFLEVRLGRYKEGQTAFESAAALFDVLNDLRGQTVCALNLCMAFFFQAKFSDARQAALQGLALARRMQSKLMEANALANLGAAERELGQLEDAIMHMEAGLAIRRSLGQIAELGTDLCDLAVAYLYSQSLDLAQQATYEMLDIFAANEAAMMHPQYILWVAAQVERASGNEPQARIYRERAYTTLCRKAEEIPDIETRASFLDLPFNREIHNSMAKISSG